MKSKKLSAVCDCKRIISEPQFLQDYMQSTANQSKKNFDATKQSNEPPRKLSKAGQWMRDNPNGIFEIVNRRAVNK